MIVAEHLRKTFPAKGKDKAPVVAVDDVGFEARDGEITGLLGPNGAGKTTTLRMLYTLMRPESGRVLVDGTDVAADAEAARRALGVLPDARGVYKRLTARENIRYFGELHGLDAATIEARTRALSTALQMDDFLDRQTEGFSQGQRTKTAIARALVHDPRNVILDEPTNGLDVMTTRGLRDFLRHLRGEGRCVIFSSHIMLVVAALCDRIVVIAHGRVVITSRPLVGSSRMTLRGSCTSARAIAVLVRCPCEKPSVRRSSMSRICRASASTRVRCSMACLDMPCSSPK